MEKKDVPLVDVAEVSEVVPEENEEVDLTLFTGGKDPALDGFMAPMQVLSWKALSRALPQLVPKGMSKKQFEMQEIHETVYSMLQNIHREEDVMQSFWHRESRCPDILVGSYLVRVPMLLEVVACYLRTMEIVEAAAPDDPAERTQQAVRKQLSRELGFLVEMRRKEEREMEEHEN